MEPTPTVWKARDFCLRCGKCCRETEMLLTGRDVRRLAALGYEVEDFCSEKEGRYYLRNVEGCCYFFDRRRNSCRVYPYRPLGCSLYPIVYDLEEGDVAVDRYCPLAHTTTEREMEEARVYLEEILRGLLGQAFKEGDDIREG